MSNVCPKCGTDYDGAEKFCPKDGTKLGGAEGEEYVKRPSVMPEDDPLIGKVIQKRYRVIEQLGEGGMGVVYVAEHVEIEKKVALKVLRDDFSKRPEVVARFRQEARSASKVGSAHIVDVTDFGQLENGGVYFVMEYLKGKGLSEVIRKEKIELDRAINIVTQIANALQEAHKMGIVHRDLKPENIFLVEQDESKDFVKVLDFGIAKISDRDSEGERLTKTGMIFGTPEYMSPEQAAGRELDNRVDIYALGCIMYEIFTGTVPFDGDSFMAILTQHMFEPVQEINEKNKETVATESVQAVVYKAMAKEKENRYESMKELAEDLKRAAKDNRYGKEEKDRYKGQDNEKSTIIDWTTVKKEKGEKEKSKKSLAIIISIVIIAVIGIALYLKNEKEEKIEIAAEETKENKKEEKIVEVKEKEKKEEEVKEKEIREKEEEKKIKVEIESEPKGAVIIIAGLGQVCSSAPCDIELEEGKSLEIEARFGKGENKKMRFTPSEQNRNIKLEKEDEKKIKRKKKEKPTEKKEERKNKSDNGLKIPVIFKDN